MQITIEIPDDLAHQLETTLGNLPRHALESFIVEAYRQKSLSAAEVQRILGLPTHLSTDAFLKQHNAPLHYTEADLDQDLAALDRTLGQS
jgi:predicted HTH domain antitoxin